MSNSILQFELIQGLPENYGNYLFLLIDGSITEGTIRVAQCEDQEFHYERCVGWLKLIV